MTAAAMAPGDWAEPPEMRLFSVGAAPGGRWLFRSVDVVVPPGGWLTVMGPSGSGKTTLVRLLAGLLGPTEGEALIAGRGWVSLRDSDRVALRRKFGYVQQQPGLLNATVLQNVMIPLLWRGRPREEATQAAREGLALVGMRGSEARNALSLSGGERQRVAFARAIATDPAILLLDEFTNHQDPTRAEALESIVGDRVRRGASAVLVAHDLGQVDRIRRQSGRRPTIGVLIDGRWLAVPWDRLQQALAENGIAGIFLRTLVAPNPIERDGATT